MHIHAHHPLYRKSCIMIAALVITGFRDLDSVRSVDHSNGQRHNNQRCGHGIPELVPMALGCRHCDRSRMLLNRFQSCGFVLTHVPVILPSR
jgi:hypothetical protein